MIERYRNGSGNAFEEICQAYSRPFLNHIKINVKSCEIFLNDDEVERKASRIMREIWEKLRVWLLVTPENGGYNCDKKGTFYYRIIRKYGYLINLTNQKISSLVEEFRRGDQDALDEIYEVVYEPALMAIQDEFGEILKGNESEQLVNETRSWLAEPQIRENLKEMLKDPSEGGYKFRKNADMLQCIIGECFGIKKQNIDAGKNLSLNTTVYSDDKGEIMREPFDPTDIPKELIELQARQKAAFQLVKLVCCCGGYPHEQLAFLYSKFIYGKPIYNELGKGIRKKKTIQGDPKGVAEKHGFTILEELMLKLEKKLEEELGKGIEWELETLGSKGIGIGNLKQSLQPIFMRMDYHAGELMEVGKTAKRMQVAVKRIAKTILADYIDYEDSDDSIKAERECIERLKSRIAGWSDDLRNKILLVMGLEKIHKGAAIGLEESVDVLTGKREEINYGFSKHCSRCKLNRVLPCSEEKSFYFKGGKDHEPS